MAYTIGFSLKTLCKIRTDQVFTAAVLINIIAADLLCVGIDAFIIIVAVRIVLHVADRLRGGSYRFVGISITITIEIILVGL